MKKQLSTKQKRPLPVRWLWVLCIQMIATLLLMGIFSLSLWLGGFVHGLSLWVLAPLAGFISACIATRKGLLNYAAWLVPPLMQIAANLILWGYLPEIAPVFVCGFVSLVGAATGEVLKRQHEKQRR